MDDARNSEFIPLILRNTILIPFIPIAIGGSYLAGYLLLFGRTAVMLASYEDIFKYSLLSVFPSLAILFVVFSIQRTIDTHRNTYLRNGMFFRFWIYLSLFFVSPLLLISILGIVFNEDKEAILYVVFLAYIIPVALFVLKVSVDIRTFYVISVTVFPLVYGMSDGAMVVDRASYQDTICEKEECRSVSIYAILTNHIIVIEKDNSKSLIPTERVTRLSTKKSNRGDAGL